MIETLEVCYRTLKHEKPWSLETYQKLGGYKIIRDILNNQTDPNILLAEIKLSGLRGRGGAGFPAGMKWSFVKRELPGQKYLVCNSDESEPGTFKDRQILKYNPHQIIEGLLIGGYIMNASQAFHYIRGEFYEEIKRVEQATKEARELGLLGKNILGSGFDFEIVNVFGAGAYICGEETALMNSIEGKKGLPRNKPPFPAGFGVYGKPTTINNTESFASIPVILEKGGKWFQALGTEKSGGTKIFCVSGHVNKPGYFELPLGTKFSDLLELAGGVLDGKALKAVIPGGSSVPILPGDAMMSLNMDYESLAQAGSLLGSGAVIVIAEGTCLVKVLARISKFYKEESCGQCTPCREGTGWLARVLARIEAGKGKPFDLDLLESVTNNMSGKTICALADAAAMPVQSFLKHFREEFQAHIDKQGCPFGEH